MAVVRNEFWVVSLGDARRAGLRSGTTFGRRPVAVSAVHLIGVAHPPPVPLPVANSMKTKGPRSKSKDQDKGLAIPSG